MQDDLFRIRSGEPRDEREETVPATCQRRIPTVAPAPTAIQRPGTRSSKSARRANVIATDASIVTTSSAIVRFSDEPRAKVTESARKSAASDHASVADTLRTPIARASAKPGASTSPVATISRK
jgi:hypothetical protein